MFCFKSVRLEVITLLPFAQAELGGPRGDQLDRMPRLLDVLAAYAGQLVNHSSYGAALGLTVPTAQKYVGILERLFLLKLVPPWSHNAVSRLTKTPKLHFLDSGLLAALRDATASELLKDRTPYASRWLIVLT